MASKLRLHLASLATGLVCLAFAVPAHASTVSLLDDPDSGGTFIDYVAAPGEVNVFGLGGVFSGRMVVGEGFGSDVSIITPTDPCTAGQPGDPGDSRSASCPADTLVWIRADLGDMGDYGSAGVVPNWAVVLSGGAGADTLWGGFNDDDLYGDEGVDEVHGHDWLDGGPGADQLQGGGGSDIAAYDERVDPVTATLDELANDGVNGEGDFIHMDVESVVGGSASDSLTGSAEPDGLFGGPGPDTLDGRGGADVINGEADNDTVLARDGALDDIDCGPGVDTAIVDSSDKVVGCETVSTPPLPPAPPPPPAPSLADTTAPALELSGATAQRILRQRGVLVVVSCPVEACAVTAKGKVVVRGSSKRFKLRSATKQIAKGGKATLRLKLRKKALMAIRRALMSGKKLNAKVTVTAEDTAGNVTSRRRTIRVKL
jgi:RTX calcium-binding nonapeptide repeat (4 copies)